MSAGNSPSNSEGLMRCQQSGPLMLMQGPSIHMACSSSCQARHRLNSQKAKAVLLMRDHMYTLELSCKPRQLCLSCKQSQQEGA